MVPLSQARRIVIKLGTGVLTSGIGQLNTDRISALCQQIKQLQDRGLEVILVSSGAIGLGMGKLKLKNRPKELSTLQACAAVGQSILMNHWQKGFDPEKQTVAQILLTRDDLRTKHRHNAVLDTIENLLASGTVPIVNENDTVSAAEIKFGDNDTLSALVASVVNADILFILSNISGLIDMRTNGELVQIVKTITPEIEAMAQDTKQSTSVGGMISKISAAKVAHRANCGVLIGSGNDSELFNKLLRGESVGTYFLPSNVPVKSHKRWIAIQDDIQGKVKINEKSAQAILGGGESLKVMSITECIGDFKSGDLVQVCSQEGIVLAKGIVSYGAGLIKSRGKQLKDRMLLHRDDLVLL